MKIIQSIMTKNPCYTAGRKITVKGLMLHSVGCPQPSAMAFVNSWNRADFDTACVHAFIDGNTGEVYQTLPWNHRGWHAGGSANNTHIGVEMCEPACIKYTGGSTFTCSDLATARAVVQRTYDNAVQLFAHLCREFKLDPLADGVIISHDEGGKRGVACDHDDPEHLWNGLGMGYTMDTFRKAVSALVSNDNSGAITTPEKVLYRVQVGAYTVKKYADAQLAKVKAAGFSDAFIAVVDGKLYRVQTGAFSVKENAEAQLAKVKAAGFSAFITKNGGEVVGNDYPLKQFIMDVQKACGAAVDGIAGQETLSKTITITTTMNTRHGAVLPVQKRLLTLGYDPKGLDGIYGTNTAKAVKAYQAAHGCIDDGDITAKCKTWQKLLGMIE